MFPGTLQGKVFLQSLPASCIKDCSSFQREHSCHTASTLGLGRLGRGAPADVQAASPEQGFRNLVSEHNKARVNPKRIQIKTGFLTALLRKMPSKTIGRSLSPYIPTPEMVTAQEATLWCLLSPEACAHVAQNLCPGLSPQNPEMLLKGSQRFGTKACRRCGS